MAEADRESMLAEQKKQCPFCKIIAGDIPSKKIFESEDNDGSKGVLAILDINPASEGHALVMPKEHYPILPLIPPETFKEIFSIATKIADIEKIVFLKEGTTIFIANGAAAGQQSSHFMVHVIPRDVTELSQFNIPSNDAPKEKLEEVYATLSHNLPIMLKDVYQEFPLKDDQGKKVPLKQRYSLDQVLKIIEQNPQLKEAMIKEPAEFKKAIPQNGQLAQIFEDIDVDEVISRFVPGWDPDKVVPQPASGPEKKGLQKPEEIRNEPEQATTGQSEADELKSVEEFDNILSFIESKPKLKGYMLNKTEEFKASLPGSEKLKEIFEGYEIDKVIEALRKKDSLKEDKEKRLKEGEHEENIEDTPPPAPKKKTIKEGTDLDLISRMFE